MSKLVVADSVSEHPEMRFLWQEADPVRTVEIGQAEVALHLVPLNWRAADWGYRTKRVGFVVTFRLFGAEKSVLKLVGANLKDGQNVLVL